MIDICMGPANPGCDLRPIVEPQGGDHRCGTAEYCRDRQSAGTAALDMNHVGGERRRECDTAESHRTMEIGPEQEQRRQQRPSSPLEQPQRHAQGAGVTTAVAGPTRRS